jgi:hypothetical protein
MRRVAGYSIKQERKEKVFEREHGKLELTAPDLRDLTNVYTVYIG